MASGLIGRALGVLELLTENPGGLGVQALADDRRMPLASAHRLLSELSDLGYVRQLRGGSKYVLTTKLLTMGFRCLTTNSVADFAQPALDDLAATSRELVRMGIVEESRLIWVARAQGARSGLRYDPDMGNEAMLFCTASGHAWLATLSEAEVLKIVARQGFGDSQTQGLDAPRDAAALFERLKKVREQGFATVSESAAVGTSALSAAIVRPADQVVVGTVSIAGPTARLDENRIAELVPALLRTASELSKTCEFIDYFQK